MGLFDSIFGIDILEDGKPDMLDDAIILGALEEDEIRNRREGDDDWTDEDDAIASGVMDEFIGL